MSNVPAIKPKQAKYKKYMLVRYSRMNTLGLFEHQETRIPKVNTRIVIKTERGLELGHLVGQLSLYKSGHLKFDGDQLKKYFDDSNIDIAVEEAVNSFVTQPPLMLGKSDP